MIILIMYCRLNFDCFDLVIFPLTMSRLTTEQRLNMLQIYSENHNLVRETYRALCPIYERHNRSSESAIQALVNRFRTTYNFS